MPPWTIGPLGAWKLYSGRRVPLDHRPPVGLLDAAVAERVPHVRVGRRELAPRLACAWAHRGPGTPGKRNGSTRFGCTTHARPLSGSSSTLQRRLGDERRLHEGDAELAAQLRLDERRVGEAWTDRVEPDPARREPRRRGSHPADDGVLRRRVRGIVRHAREPGERRRGDDRPAARHQARRELARPVDDALQVGAEDALPLLVRQLGGVGATRPGARVEEGGVELPVERPPCVRIADVELGQVEDGGLGITKRGRRSPRLSRRGRR